MAKAIVYVYTLGQPPPPQYAPAFSKVVQVINCVFYDIHDADKRECCTYSMGMNFQLILKAMYMYILSVPNVL